MLSKENLIKEFQKKPKLYWEVELFRERDFKRKRCEGCGKYFWTVDEERKRCGDSSCEVYGFIGKKLTKERLGYVEMWKKFERFFKRRGHSSIKRYPVIDRVRPDLFFTIASIQDFQRLENSNMIFVYPANPLIVPQICLRFSDIQNVGSSGKHLTSFCMSGQHSFNYPKEGYFKDRCMELNFEFLNKVLGIKEEDLVYSEDIWAMPDYSAFGPCIETFCKGCELVNHVFMQFQKKNKSFRELDSKVIDTGWGHERLVWFSNGSNNIYESSFGNVVKKFFRYEGLKVDRKIFKEYSIRSGLLNIEESGDFDKIMGGIAKEIGVSARKLKKEIEVVQSLYAILDHVRTLLFAVTDGGIPSNVSGGYNLRVILRRAFSFVDKHGFNFELVKIAEEHSRFLKPMFPELRGGLDNFQKIVDVEREKYKSSLERGVKIIKRMNKEEFTEDKIVRLYESYGISPESINKVIKIKIPKGVYSKITEKHESEEIKEKKVRFDLEGILPTKKLYYKDKNKFEFKAEVVKKFNNFVVLDKSYFYPGGGGQECDLGYIDKVRVKNVEKIGSVIVHELEKEIKKKEVKCKVNKSRRKILMKLHTATHIINYASRKVLGNHINQAGSHKSEEKAHLDVTHYRSISDKELEDIEKEANKVVDKKVGVKIEILRRAEAEKKYGLRIYQGGAIESDEIRIVKIDNFDIEACAGIHCSNTKEVGIIKIINSKKIQDGVVRINFVAGELAEREEEYERNLLEKTAEILGVRLEEVPYRAEELFNKWKKARKAVRKRRKINVSELEFGKPKSLKLSKRDLLRKSAEIFRTQIEHVPNVARRFLRELGEFKKLL